VLVFSCLTEHLSRERRAAGERGGVWCVPCDSVLGPFDLARAVRVADESLYSGRLIRDRVGRWVMLAFRNTGPDGNFIGDLTDPMPVSWAPGGATIRIDVDVPWPAA
jgi:beta-fructofuranosidase